MANSTNAFSISLQTNVDTSKIQKTLNQSKFVLKADLNLSNSVSEVEKRISGIIKRSGLGERINRELKKDITAVKQFADGSVKEFEHATAYVETFKNSLGQVTERITAISADNKIVGQSYNTIAHGVRQVTTEVNNSTQAYQGYSAEVKEVVKSYEMTNGETKRVISTTTSWTDVNNRLNTEIKEQTQLLDKNGNVISSEYGTAIKNVTDAEKKLEEANQKANQSFTEVLVKVAKFYLASLPIRAVQTAITDAITTVKEFDEAFTELAKVSSLSGDELDSYTEKLGELGEAVGRTRTEMIQSATEMKKAGFSEEDSALLAEIVSLYQNTADEELSASEASSVLISQIKAFNMEAEDAIHITDAINQVSQDFAVSSGDIGKGLTQAGASLSTYGNSFEQTIGLLTAGTTIFQGKSQQVARGLNQIANRVAKNEDALKKYGVEVKDENGELRSTFDILSDLKPKWDEMSNAEQVSLGVTLAGY